MLASYARVRLHCTFTDCRFRWNGWGPLRDDPADTHVADCLPDDRMISREATA